MPYISVNVDLNEFNFDDILDYVFNQVKNKISLNKLHDSHEIKLIMLFNQITRSNLNQSPTKKRLMDEMKMEYLSKIFDKYTLQQIENSLSAFPSYEFVITQIYKWADEIRMPSGYDGDLEELRKRLSVLWHLT